MKRNNKKGMNRLADKIRDMRLSRGWTQEDLSKRSGINRVTLASIETGKIKNPSTEIFLKTARAFGIVPEELYKAAGYISDYNVPSDRNLTLNEILNFVRNSLPIEYPVYSLKLFADFGMDIPAEVEPIIRMYRPRSSQISGRITGFVVDSDYMKPLITATDIIILENDADIKDGDIIASVIDGKTQIGRFSISSDKFVLENDSGHFLFDSNQEIIKVIRVNKLL
jgi:transcriptional regulator with XRE-family HTH domain